MAGEPDILILKTFSNKLIHWPILEEVSLYILSDAMRATKKIRLNKRLRDSKDAAMIEYKLIFKRSTTLEITKLKFAPCIFTGKELFLICYDDDHFFRKRNENISFKTETGKRLGLKSLGSLKKLFTIKLNCKKRKSWSKISNLLQKLLTERRMADFNAIETATLSIVDHKNICQQPLEEKNEI